MSQGAARNAVRREKRLAVVSRVAAAVVVEAMPTRPAAVVVAEMAADTVVVMPATDLAVKCSRPHARHAERRREFLSSHVATSQCTARSASRWYVAAAAAAADTLSLCGFRRRFRRRASLG